MAGAAAAAAAAAAGDGVSDHPAFICRAEMAEELHAVSVMGERKYEVSLLFFSVVFVKGNLTVLV